MKSSESEQIGAAHLFRGEIPRTSLPVVIEPGDQILVTVWQDGTAEVSFRPDFSRTWDRPIPLEEVSTK